jgi:transcriptional regulator with GAF, ATPase, and Fis domain
VRRSLDHHRLIQEVQTLRTALDRKYGFDEIVGSSPALLETLDLAARMAASDATVLLAGETGTGKELVAKAIHLRSNRRDRPFVAINCGAVHRELLESELFGHVKGSFTGAFTHKKGKIEMADGGTLLLDEIGEMPLQLQVRLLRVIQEREIEKIGATSSTKVDVRIIAATHRDLLAMVKQGTFREDLYYRILVVPITLPPLRNRPGDVEILVDHFFLKFRTRYNRRDLTLQPGLMRLLVEYSWPGNVRELENAVERMVLLSRGNELTTADLPESIRPQPVVEPIAATSAREGGPPTLQELEQKLIVQALKECGGNQTRAARYLGISRRTLAYRLEKYGLHGESLKALKQGSA